MNKEGLQSLFEEEEKSTTGRIKESILSEKSLSDIHGIIDVKENLMSALDQAEFISKQGYTPIILLIGPSGSGKTEIINSLVRGYKKYSVSHDVFTLNIDGKKCQYNENPYNIFRSILPSKELNKDTRKLMNNKRPEICYHCESNLEKIIKDGKFDEDKINLEKIFPKSSIVEFGDSFLLPSFINVIMNSNRSILAISADKSKLEDINPKVFQLFNNIYDNNFSDNLGNKVPLDSLILMHSNESFMELNEDRKRESRPLLERIIRVDVRRNLSYSEEMKVAQESNMPIEKVVPKFLEYISKLNVLSRLSFDLIYNKENQYINNVLELLDYYDSDNLKGLERKMTQTMSNFLGGILNTTNAYVSETDSEKSKYLKDAARSFIFDLNDKPFEYKSGWTSGISSRSISSILDLNCSSDKLTKHLSFSDVAKYLNKNEEKINDSAIETIKNYMDSIITNDIKFDVSYALLSFYFGDNFKNYTGAITRYFDSIVSPSQGKEFRDLEGYLTEAGKYFDLNTLKDQVSSFKLDVIPLSTVNYETKFDDLLHFLVSKNKSFIKVEQKYNSFIGEEEKEVDKSSELYYYIKNFLKNIRGYPDESIEDAFKIYKREGLFYD
jgi:energy-coupling factor transporter ATP-binding protein EcfA2